jgi:hypothetical protein
LLSAVRSCNSVGNIEKANSGQPFGEFFEEIIGHCIACTLSSAATLEAYANELFADSATIFPDLKPMVASQMWDLAEDQSILRKFDVILTLRHKEPFDQGKQPYQNAALLIRLRNTLVHFKPEWSGENSNHAKLSGKLDAVMQPGSIYFKGEKMFPVRWMTHKGVCWVVDSTIGFMEGFEALCGLPTKTDYSKLQF